MSIPRQLGPQTERRALPDYSRSDATVERMVRNLQGSRGSSSQPMVRALMPAHATRDTLIRSIAAAVLLGAAVAMIVTGVLLWAGLEDGRSPGLAMLMVLLSLGGLALILGLLGVRFVIAALASARARVEVGEAALRVVGVLGARTVDWDDVIAIESRVVHPVHWLTAGLRLRDGSRVIMPAFDRPLWEYSRPSGQDIRTLRTELHQRESARRTRR